jgi:hypothetical protein
MAGAADRMTVPIAIGLFVLALAVSLELARPFMAASVAFDSQVSALHFARILSGERLEALITTTPKPLLTVVFGIPYALTHDWRPIGWLTIIAFAIGVAGAGILAGRLAGPSAAAFSGLGLIAAPAVLVDVGFALATPWALVGWVGAGLAVTRPSRPRYGLAGLALLWATLARIETLVLVGVIVASIVVAAIVRRSPGRAAWLVPGIALLALPIMGIHDLLLAGDPLMWTRPAGAYSAAAGLDTPSPIEVISLLAGRYAELGAITLLAVIGVARLVLAGRWPIVVGLIGLGPAIAAFLVLLSVRGIFVAERYAAPVDAALLFAAGIGFAGLSTDVWRRLARATGRPTLGRYRHVARVAAAVVAAVVLTWPVGPFDRELRESVRRSLRAAVDTDRAAAVLATELAGRVPGSASIVVPTSVMPRLVLALDAPITAFVASDGISADDLPEVLSPGTLIAHLADAERRPGTLAALEIDGPSSVDGASIEPIYVDADGGVWIVRVN